MGSDLDTPSARLDWVDTAKAIGIVLMFYGHVVQSVAQHGNASALDTLRFIYAFHMPLFFVLAGFFYRPATHIGEKLRRLALQRLVPVLFFGLLLLPLWSVSAMKQHLPWWTYAKPLGAAYLAGHPELDWVTWFLVCMFLCEVIAQLVLPRIRSAGANWAFAIACLVGGVALCNHADALNGWLGAVGRTWFVREAIVALGFYVIGHEIFPLARQLSAQRAAALALAVAGTAFVLGTYRSNHVQQAEAVMMAAAAHGDAYDFATTALAGSLAVIALAMLLPATRWTRWMGRHTVPLLGLNGAFFHFFNPKLADLLPPADTPWAVAAYACAMTAVSLLACVPAVMLLDRFLPQLIGQVERQGPVLPALLGRATRHAGRATA